MELVMKKKKDCACWNIMNCKIQDKCLTKSNPKKTCWEICYLQNEFQKVFEICRNCHVFVNKKIDHSLTSEVI